ncbi:hypothetical protein BT96DRAFT_1018705 [Gymnopus androsaceus JB14]|uniref:Uncharacterized protein n=1 Tax=Gymnopus androsaceus JB14 TaxID=1447944 RepID=A0A6A4HQF9_9AGAR|nr:hypothetical protein BT96DRAFT_1018705 [Gymnopus androsaceus JB14]
MLALVFLLSAFATSVLATVTGTSGTIVLAQTNGDLVEAACVDTSVDRQITPATNTAGTSVLLIERQYGAAHNTPCTPNALKPAASLVGVTPCIGFNGTDFVAQDCDTMTAPVTFVSGELVAGTACSTGCGCATFTATTVPRVIDNAGTLASTNVFSVATTADATSAATDVASTNTSTSGTVTRTSGTVVLAQTNGVAGEQCITFTNNGDIVKAACVDNSVDRQITPATNAAGTSVLLIERSVWSCPGRSARWCYALHWLQRHRLLSPGL